MLSAVVQDVKGALKAEGKEFSSWEVENERAGEMFWQGDLIWVWEDMQELASQPRVQLAFPAGD